MRISKQIETGEERRITIAEFQMIGKKGKYQNASIEPPNCRYLRTYGGGRLRETETPSLDYDDFDLYENSTDSSFCYRFWKRDYHEGKESGKSYAEPVSGFATEEAAVGQALAVFRGEEEEQVSEELRQWRQWAFWVGHSVLLEHRIRDEPQRASEIYDLVMRVRPLVHPAAREHWSRLENIAQNALADPSYSNLLKSSDQARASEWSRAQSWERKLRAAWRKLERAQSSLLDSIKAHPKEDLAELDLTAGVQTALLEYMGLLGKLGDARWKDRRK